MAGKVALITGASGGIGGAASKALAAEGYSVLLHYRSNPQSAEQLCEEIKAAGGNAEIYGADLSDYNAAGEMTAWCVQNMGSIDCLVNNAGMTSDALLMQMDDGQFMKVINANLLSCFNCTQHASRYMIRQRSGCIINVSSVAGVAGNAGQANYAASKAGMIGLTKSTARELARRNIRANAVAPGYVVTPMTDSLPQAVKDRMLENIALRRFAQPEEVAGVISFLASERASYITGQVIIVDGGMVI